MPLLSTYKAQPKRLSFQVAETPVITPVIIEKPQSPGEVALQAMINKNPYFGIFLQSMGIDLKDVRVYKTSQSHSPGGNIPLSIEKKVVSLNDMYRHMDRLVKPDRHYTEAELIELMRHRLLRSQAEVMFPSLLLTNLLGKLEPGIYYRKKIQPYEPLPESLQEYPARAYKPYKAPQEELEETEGDYIDEEEKSAQEPQKGPKTGYLILKAGTLGDWDIKTVFKDRKKAEVLLNEYHSLGVHFNPWVHRNTPEQKRLVCELIDLCVKEKIYLRDVGGLEHKKYRKKEEAKKYINEWMIFSNTGKPNKQSKHKKVK